jgi:DNA-binding NarL/FixJ family response regulator
MNVLIVEDELLIAMDLEMAVTALGHRVCGIVASARDAITQAGAHQPYVTLMDIRLSGDSSGVDATCEI